MSKVIKVEHGWKVTFSRSGTQHLAPLPHIFLKRGIVRMKSFNHLIASLRGRRSTIAGTCFLLMLETALKLNSTPNYSPDTFRLYNNLATSESSKKISTKKRRGTRCSDTRVCMSMPGVYFLRAAIGFGWQQVRQASCFYVRFQRAQKWLYYSDWSMKLRGRIMSTTP